jgi:hypothetical protein
MTLAIRATHFPTRVLRTATAAAATCLTIACGGGSDGNGVTNPPPQQGSFTLSASGSTVSVALGANGTVTLTIARSGSFTGAVVLSVNGLPSGVTGAFNPAQMASGQASSTLTITAASAAATGTATITVRGAGTGVADQTVSIQVTVTATAPPQPGAFSLSVSATSFLFHPSNQLFKSPVITIARNAGFTAPVAFTVTGLPTSLFAGVTPSSTAGNKATVVPLNLGATPNGTYTATITGTSAGQPPQSVTIQLVVASPTAGAIKWKFCSASLPRFFFAVKDGSGPWTRIMPALDTSFSFNVQSATASVAEVYNDSGGFRVHVSHYTAAEIAARAASQCQLVRNVSSRTANGSFGGVTGSRQSFSAMGWWFGSANGNGNFSLLNLPPGPLDLFAARTDLGLNLSSVIVDAMILRRGVNPASGSTLPVLNFTAAEAFAPTASTWTFANTGGESFSLTQLFNTAGGTNGLITIVPGADGTPVARTVYGVPLAQTVAGDLHQVIATVFTAGQTAGSPVRATRQLVTYARTLSDRNLALPPAMPASNVTVVTGGPGGRLRAQGTLPNELNAGASLDITQTTTARFATVQATRGFLGAGNSYVLEIPDLGAAIGWDSEYQLIQGVPTNWWVSGGGPVLDFFDSRYIFNSTRARWAGALTGVAAPADGATYLMARAVGGTTP